MFSYVLQQVLCALVLVRFGVSAIILFEGRKSVSGKGAVLCEGHFLRALSLITYFWIVMFSVKAQQQFTNSAASQQTLPVNTCRFIFTLLRNSDRILFLCGFVTLFHLSLPIIKVISEILLYVKSLIS